MKIWSNQKIKIKHLWKFHGRCKRAPVSPASPPRPDMEYLVLWNGFWASGKWPWLWCFKSIVIVVSVLKYGEWWLAIEMHFPGFQTFEGCISQLFHKSLWSDPCDQRYIELGEMGPGTRNVWGWGNWGMDSSIAQVSNFLFNFWLPDLRCLFLVRNCTTEHETRVWASHYSNPWVYATKIELNCRKKFRRFFDKQPDFHMFFTKPSCWGWRERCASSWSLCRCSQVRWQGGKLSSTDAGDLLWSPTMQRWIFTIFALVFSFICTFYG